MGSDIRELNCHGAMAVPVQCKLLVTSGAEIWGETLSPGDAGGRSKGRRRGAGSRWALRFQAAPARLRRGRRRSGTKSSSSAFPCREGSLQPRQAQPPPLLRPRDAAGGGGVTWSNKTLKVSSRCHLLQPNAMGDEEPKRAPKLSGTFLWQ